MELEPPYACGHNEKGEDKFCCKKHYEYEYESNTDLVNKVIERKFGYVSQITLNYVVPIVLLALNK